MEMVLSEKKMPMALFKPYGYAAKRYVSGHSLSLVVFFIFKYITSKKIRKAQDMAEKNSPMLWLPRSLTIKKQHQLVVVYGTDEETQSTSVQ